MKITNVKAQGAIAAALGVALIGGMVAIDRAQSPEPRLEAGECLVGVADGYVYASNDDYGDSAPDSGATLDHPYGLIPPFTEAELQAAKDEYQAEREKRRRAAEQVETHIVDCASLRDDPYTI